MITIGMQVGGARSGRNIVAGKVPPCACPVYKKLSMILLTMTVLEDASKHRGKYISFIFLTV